MNSRRLTAAVAAVVGSFSLGLVGAAPASATVASSVTPGAVTVTPNTAGSNAVYDIPFSVATAVGDGGTITFVAPSGTDFVSCTSCSGVYSIAVNNSDAATVASAAATSANGSPTNNQVVLTLGTSTINAGDQVAVSTTNTTNPQGPSTSYQIQEATSSDTAAAGSPDYTITASAAASINPSAGGGQSAEINHAFAQLMKATVQDAYGNPVAGVAVTFTAPSSGASGSFTASGCPRNTAGTPGYECVVTTDGNGLATAAVFTANGTTGSYNVQASAQTTAGTSTANFALANTGVPPTAVTGGTTSANPDTEAATSVTYTVTFTTNQIVPQGGTITLTAPNGTVFPAGSGGTCGLPVDTTSCTNPTVAYGNSATSVFVANAVASAAQGPGATTTSGTNNSLVVTIGSSGNLGTAANSIPAGQLVTVSIAGATNPSVASPSYVIAESDSADPSPADTSDYAIVPGAATKLVISGGNNQSATVATPFATALEVTAEDSNSNPVGQGTSVTFLLAHSSGRPSGTFPGGTSTQQTNITNAKGQAFASAITANHVAGLWPATAQLAGAVSPQTFNLTNTAGAATTVVDQTGDQQSATVVSPYATDLAATVEDAYGNPVSGTPVTFTSPGTVEGTFAACAGNSNSTPATECIVSSDSSGVATAGTLTAGTLAGQFSVVASIPSSATSNFTETNTAASPSAVNVVHGGNQSATVDTAFALPLEAQVVDQYGNPVSGEQVTFAPPTSAASGSFASCADNTGGTPAGDCVVTTDSSGDATSSAYTANGTAGSDQPTATDTTPSVSIPAATFSLTNNSGAAATLSTTSTAQSAVVGTAYANPLTAKVTDTGGNAVSGQTVTFAAPGSGASGTFDTSACSGNTISTPATQCIVTTDSSGVATAGTFTANTKAGAFQVTATSGTLSGSPVSIGLTNTAGAVAHVVAHSGAGQSAAAGSAFPNPVVVEVTDAFGNPVHGAYVLFTTPSSGASATFPGNADQAAGTGSSDASGLVSSPTFAANHTAGNWTMSAEAYSCQGPCPVPSSTITIAETNTADTIDATSFTVFSGTGQSAHIGQPFPHSLAVRIIDKFGNPVPGISVTFTVPTGSPRGTFPSGVGHATTTSNSSGVATAPALTANLVPGTWPATASATVGATGKSAQFVLANTDGYWLVGSDGSLQSKGDATFDGSAAGQQLSAPIVGMAANPAGTGYWFLGADGGVFNYGKAPFHGSAYGKLGSARAVAIASTPTGQGYWVVGSNGSVFAFGDAKPYGNLTAYRLAKPIVGLAVTSDGKGYWMVGGDGGVFRFGDANFYGSEGNQKLNAPVIGMAADPATGGYWLVASDGGVFSFHATFFGSAGAAKLSAPVAGMVAAPSGQGYWLFGKDGGVFNYGPEAKFYGSGAGSGEPVVGLAEG
jgi:hypothetical protein